MFSNDSRHRYRLWRTLANHPGERAVVFVGLNPSTADENTDDPTVRRMLGFAERWGASRLEVLNAYALRSTDPRALREADDPVGIDNDAWIRLITRQTQRPIYVIAAWGANCESARDAQLRSLLPPGAHALGFTKAGYPRHPLYLPNVAEPEPLGTARAIIKASLPGGVTIDGGAQVFIGPPGGGDG